MEVVGDKLRAERERQNLTIKEIEKGTSIRSLYIENIELGKFDQMPGEVYIKGFIRNYANFLHLDAAELVRAYMEENHPGKGTQEPDSAASPQAQSERVTTRHDTSQMTSGLRQRVDRSHHRQNLFAAAALVVVALAVGAFFFFENASPDAEQMRQTSQ